jgi:diguanylate cyclase (GGDEF)-like protein/PAS domain S-box-containing protein
MSQRLRAFAQTTTYLGVAVIASIWCGVFFLTHEEHERAYQEGLRQGSNLARVFEQYIARAIGGADSVLLTLRDSYEHDPSHFELARLVNNIKLKNDWISQFAIVGPDGFVGTLSGGRPHSNQPMSDRSYFRFQANAQRDELFISEPLVGRASGNRVIVLSRRLTARDGSFGGVIRAAIDISELQRFYDSVDIGKGGIIALVGFDGIVRARTGRDPATRAYVGQSIPQSKMSQIYRQSPAGSFWNSEGKFEGISRLISHRTVEGLPLIAVVGLSEDDIFLQSNATARRYYLIAFFLTLSVVVAIGIAAIRQRKLSSTMAAFEQSKRSLEQTNLWFNTALENMPYGLCMFDREQRLLVCNEHYGEMYGLTRDQTKPGTPVRSILEARVAAGNSPEDADTYVEQTLDMIQGPEPYYVEVELRDKRILALNYQPMPGGGWVATHEDITEAKRKEASFRLLFNSNPVPMWVFDRDSLRFLAVNDAALAHYGYSREQFLAMSVLDLRPPEDHVKFEQFLRTLPDTQRDMDVGEHQKSDGTKIAVSVFSQTLNYGGHRARLAAVHDVTRQKLSEDELRRTRKFLDTIIEHVPLPISVKDVPGGTTDAREGRFTLVNRAFEKLMGDPRSRVIGKTLHEVYPKQRADMIVASDSATLQSNEPVLVREHSIATSAGVQRTMTATKVAVRDDDGKPQYLLTVLEDVTERRRAEQRIAHMAHCDALTDLPNRAAFNEHLAATLAESAKTGRPFAVLAIDLDRFKEVNDVFGHAVGDALLREIARRLRTAAGSAFVARLGGDEFSFIVADGPQPATASALADRLLAVVADDFEVEGLGLRIGLSVGVAVYPTDSTNAATLLNNADAALYRSKSEARGTVRFFEAEMDKRLRERLSLQNDLRSAIDRGELLLHYQPQVRMSGETVGFEALVRWQCPKRGLVSPGTFIPIAEDSSLIISIGEWVLREACREAASWSHQLRIAVNVSPIQFRYGDLPKVVHSILLQTGLAASRLELEITESVMISDFSRAVSILRRLKSLGVRIAMDDFGTGYSSLSFLQSFPCDKIKIDRAFIRDLEDNHHSRAIVRAVIGLGRSLDTPVLAEGVETNAQHALLLAEGCDEVQGYLTGRPQPIADYADQTDGQATAQRHHIAAG